MNMNGYQAERNAPVSLSDGVGGHNDFIEKNIIPQLLGVIESSGLSFEDAKLVPHKLKIAIKLVNQAALSNNCFKLP